jgi:hypothetical protein
MYFIVVISYQSMQSEQLHSGITILSAKRNATLRVNKSMKAWGKQIKREMQVHQHKEWENKRFSPAARKKT